MCCFFRNFLTGRLEWNECENQIMWLSRWLPSPYPRCDDPFLLPSLDWLVLSVEAGADSSHLSEPSCAWPIRPLLPLPIAVQTGTRELHSGGASSQTALLVARWLVGPGKGWAQGSRRLRQWSWLTGVSTASAWPSWSLPPASLTPTGDWGMTSPERRLLLRTWQLSGVTPFSSGYCGNEMGSSCGGYELQRPLVGVHIGPSPKQATSREQLSTSDR